jgi:hypothetical protein
MYGESFFGTGKFRLHRNILLDSCEVTNNKNIHEQSTSFVIASPAKSFLVHAETESEATEWKESIDSAIEELRKKNKDKRPLYQRGSIAPLWTPDNQSNTCMKCDKQFDFFLNRRHHCRSCGDVVCKDCSSKKFLLSEMDSNQVRVCDTCYRSLSQKSLKNRQEANINTENETEGSEAQTRVKTIMGYDVDDWDDVDVMFRNSVVNGKDLDLLQELRNTLIEEEEEEEEEDKKDLPEQHSKVTHILDLAKRLESAQAQVQVTADDESGELDMRPMKPPKAQKPPPPPPPPP